MTKKNTGQRLFTEEEIQIVERLRQNPELMARFQSIMDLASSAEGPLKTADEVEELLIQEMRRLGNATMNKWASGAEARVGTELRQQDTTIRSRKKKR